VIVEAIALSTMVCNDLVMPVLLRMKRLRLAERRDLSALVLAIRRGAILLIVLLGYLYFRLAGEAYALVAIGLISFAAVAQFAPAFLGGMYWKGATHAGAFAGLICGFAVWMYTLLLPAFAKSGWLPTAFLSEGMFGIDLLQPTQLFGLTGLDQITHAMLWSMLANCGAYIGVSLVTKQSVVEFNQASLFVDVFKRAGGGSRFWQGTASAPGLHALLARFVGKPRADDAFAAYAERSGVNWPNEELRADASLVNFTETQLAGAIGAASARIMVASVVKEEELGIDEVMGMLDEASQLIEYSHKLEQKSAELEAATTELREANERLQELDRMKDDFVSTVSHELRTPLTSIRAFSEILRDNPRLDEAKRTKYLDIVIKEAERLTRLINQVLDLAKIESGKVEWRIAQLDLNDVINESLAATSQLFSEKKVKLQTRLPERVPPVLADRDRLIQVVVNLLSNGVKFCDSRDGRVWVAVSVEDDALRVDVRDNGKGVRPQEQSIIFEKFRQAGDALTEKPKGTGLGLAISREIITHFGGRLWVESGPGGGATFSFTLPRAAAEPVHQPLAEEQQHG
jgi:signal transduction histidine kinase